MLVILVAGGVRPVSERAYLSVPLPTRDSRSARGKRAVLSDDITFLLPVRYVG